MTPAQVIVAATRNSAELMGLTDMGTLAAGKSADFVVLDANPLDDITNTRKISSVYLRGAQVGPGRDQRQAHRGEHSTMIRTLGKWVGIALGAVVLLLGSYVAFQTTAFARSMGKVYDVAVPTVQISTDSAVIERGRHLAESVAGCAGGDCHGVDLSGGTGIDVGPLGFFSGPNITTGGLGAQYSDAEIARVIRHGIRRDGKSVRFMPSQELSWLPDDDVAAIVSYVRSLPAVQKPNGEVKIGLLARVLDRHDMIIVDVARRIDHENRPDVPPPAPDRAVRCVPGAQLLRLPR
jgi:hypothetical protein